MARYTLNLPGGIKVLDQKPADSKYFNNSDTVYTNVAQVLSELPIGVRHPGLTVNVAGVEYFWPPNGGVTDGELVAKPSNSDLQTQINNVSNVANDAANKQLSNLNVPTAFNADLIPGTDRTRSLGSILKFLLGIFTQRLFADEFVVTNLLYTNTITSENLGGTISFDNQQLKNVINPTDANDVVNLSTITSGINDSAVSFPEIFYQAAGDPVNTYTSIPSGNNGSIRPYMELRWFNYGKSTIVSGRVEGTSIANSNIGRGFSFTSSGPETANDAVRFVILNPSIPDCFTNIPIYFCVGLSSGTGGADDDLPIMAYGRFYKNVSGNRLIEIAPSPQSLLGQDGTNRFITGRDYFFSFSFSYINTLTNIKNY